MIFSYAASAHVSALAEAAFHSVDVGEDAIQSSVALVASCHISVAGSTGVHVSAVPASGSHFSIALQTALQTAPIDDPLNCTRVTVAEDNADADTLGATLTIVTAFDVALAKAAAEPSQRRTLVAAAVTLPAGAEEASESLTRSTVLVADAAGLLVAAARLIFSADADVATDIVTVAAPSRTRWASEVLLEAVTTIEADRRTRVEAATVALTVTTVLAAAFTAPSTPKALEPYDPVPKPVL